jgi:hypothetical protein
MTDTDTALSMVLGLTVVVLALLTFWAGVPV